MNVVIRDATSEHHRQALQDALWDMKDSNQVAGLFSFYPSQALERVCKVSVSTSRTKSNRAPWSDK